MLCAQCPGAWPRRHQDPNPRAHAMKGQVSGQCRVGFNQWLRTDSRAGCGRWVHERIASTGHARRKELNARLRLVTIGPLLFFAANLARRVTWPREGHGDIRGALAPTSRTRCDATSVGQPGAVEAA